MSQTSWKSAILRAMLLMGLSAQANAEYLRFWRGEMRDDISSSQFVDGLNHGLFPATGELAKGPSKLLSYQPVIASPEAIKFALPEEVALLQYESETTYKSFRQTPEGIHYGDLHWNYFKKDLSKSLVVEPWQGSISLEKAYSVGAVGQTWNFGHTSYRAFVRGADMPEERYLQIVSGYLDGIKSEGKSKCSCIDRKGLCACVCELAHRLRLKIIV